MNDSIDFQDADRVRSGHSHVTSQPVSFPPNPIPGGMLSRSTGMPSRREGPPSIWDTWYVGKRFCRYSCVFFSTLSATVESMEFYVGDAGNTSLVDAGTDRGRYPRECWLSTLGVLHPGVPVMWYGHIRDLSPTAEGCKGGRVPNATRLHWAQQN